MTAIPVLAALPSMLMNGWHSDRSGERRWQAALSLLAAALLLVVSQSLDRNVSLAMVLLSGAAMGVYGYLPEEEEWPDGVIPEEGWFGGPSEFHWWLAAPFSIPASIRNTKTARAIFRTWSRSFIPRRPTSEWRHSSIPEGLGDQSYQKLLDLRARIAAVLREHRIEVLDEAVLDLPPGFKANEEIFREEPLCVRDAFFFRGI